MSELTYDDLRTKYGLFFLAMNQEYDYAHFQQQILSPIYEAIVAGDPKYRRTMVTMPFRHSKTSMGTISLIPYFFGHHPKKNVILVCYGKSLARSFGRSIRNMMKSDLYKELFPASALSPSSSAADEFETVSGGKFYAGSFDTGVNGRGCNILYVDDPCKSREDAQSDVVMEKVRSTYTNVVNTRLEPDAAILINTTRWTPGDIPGWRMAEDGAWDTIADKPYVDGTVTMPKGPWQVIRLRAEATTDEGWRTASCDCGLVDRSGLLVPHGQQLWPERWTCKALHDLKTSDSTVWESSYQQEPTVAGGFWFSSIPLNYYEKVETRGMNVYGICDPALSKRKGADYTTIFFFAIGGDGNYYWLELLRARLNPTERADAIFRLHRKWRPVGFGYEEYGLQADTVTLKDRMERENYRFPIVELGRRGLWHNLSKQDRIRTLIPLGNSGRIWLPNPETPGRDAKEVETIRYFVENEWGKYPAVRHDDVLDVVSRVNDPDMNIKQPIPPASYARTYVRPPNTSWMYD